MMERDALLAQPPEFFQSFFGGRTPTLAEKIQFVESAVQRMASQNIYENDQYHVEIVFAAPFIHVNIRRHDGQPCKDWRHFQQIKNMLIGPEFEAVELFPAESRLVDTSNEYHLWVCADRNFRFPFETSGHRMFDEVTSVPGGEGNLAPGAPLAADRLARSAAEVNPDPVAHSRC